MKLFVFLVISLVTVNCEVLNLLRANGGAITKNGDGSKQVVNLKSFAKPATLIFDKDIQAEVTLDGNVISSGDLPSKYLEIDLSNNVGQKGVPLLITDKKSGAKINVLFHEA